MVTKEESKVKVIAKKTVSFLLWLKFYANKSFGPSSSDSFYITYFIFYILSAIFLLIDITINIENLYITIGGVLLSFILASIMAYFLLKNLRNDDTYKYKEVRKSMKNKSRATRILLAIFVNIIYVLLPISLIVIYLKFKYGASFNW